MTLLSRPDDAHDEHFHGATELEARCGITLTRVEDFVYGQSQARHRA